MGQAIQTVVLKIQLEGFFLKQTPNIDTTIEFLVCVTNQIEEITQRSKLDKIVHSMHLDVKQFNHLFSKNKNLTKSEVNLIPIDIKIFGRQLTTIHGITSQKALAIIQKYPTPHSLINAFKRTKDPNMLKTIQYDGKSISESLSQLIFQIFCSNSY
jgi:crossover junction endonuclease MUS81